MRPDAAIVAVPQFAVNSSTSAAPWARRARSWMFDSPGSICGDNTSPFSTVSLRLTRAFRLGRRTQIEGLAEAFNLFDRRNDIARVTVFGPGAYPTNPASNFGTVTVVGDPRSWQFGARVRF